MKGEMHFIKSGLLTTIQDQGRFGMREYGIPLSGAMDQYSADLCNMILGNPKNTPLFEITLQGPAMRFSQPTTICITGAHLSPQVNDQAIDQNKRVKISAGDILSFGKPTYGVRCYLGLIGGFECDYVLGSASQYQFVTPKSRMEEGARLSYSSYVLQEKGLSKVRFNEKHFSSDILDAVAGPDSKMLGNATKSLLAQNWRVTSNDRMGYILTCEEADFSHRSTILTAPVTPGTIQLTPSGKLIVLMRDAQVTGGYPRVLQLHDERINQLAQKRDGEIVRFR